MSERLGHADPAFTLRTHTHLMPDSTNRTRTVIDAAFDRLSAQPHSPRATDAPQMCHSEVSDLHIRWSTALVTQYYDWSEISQRWRERGIFPIISEASLKATPGILDRTVRRRAR